MSNITLPNVNSNMAVPDLIEVVAKLIKEVQFLTDGNISSTNAREFGGYQVGLTSLTSKNGVVGISSEITAADDIRFWAGDLLSGSPIFRVYESGKLVASNVDVTGKITASSGTIGGWLIGSTYLTDAAGSVGMSSLVTGGDDIRFWAGNVTAGSAPYYVTESGLLHGSKIDLSSGTGAKKVTLLTSDELFGAYASATGHIKIGAYNNITGAPYQIFTDGSDDVNIDLISSQFTIDSKVPIYIKGTNIDLSAQGGEVILYPAYSSGKKIRIPFFDDIYADYDGMTLQTALDNLQSGITSKVTSGSSTSGYSIGDHNHGIAPGTLLLDADGVTTHTWVASGAFTHSHTV